MTDTTPALIAEARKAMEGITDTKGQSTFWEAPIDEVNDFIVWCGNGGVRRLVERLEELEARDAGD